MRGRRDPQPSLFYAIDVEDRIRPDHPLRPIKAAVDRILAGLSDRFDAAYSDTGRPSVPPERLLKALLLMALYSVRSERQLVRADRHRPAVPLVPGHAARSEPAFDATDVHPQPPAAGRARADGRLLRRRSSGRRWRPACAASTSASMAR